jgi:hypothetical protein
VTDACSTAFLVALTRRCYGGEAFADCENSRQAASAYK